jgi:hypothetical protein
MPFRARIFPRIILVMVLALVVTSMIVPSSVLDFIRFRYGWIDAVIDFLFTATPGLDMDHLTAFGVLGFAAHFGWSRGRAWQVGLGILAVAALVEFIQIWIPGRDPAVTHALLDLIGGMAGFGFAWVLTYAWGSRGLPQH